MKIKRERWIIVYNREFILCGSHENFAFRHISRINKSNIKTYSSKSIAEDFFSRIAYLRDYHPEFVEVCEIYETYPFRFKKEKRERCLYCQDGAPLISNYENNHKITIEKKCRLKYYGDSDDDNMEVKIRYCPYCGKELL